MTKLCEMQFTENEYGQKVYRGKIHLKADTQMLNEANDGKEAHEFVKPYKVMVKAGTLVEYIGRETRTGFYHTVIYRNGKGAFYCTRRGE